MNMEREFTVFDDDMDWWKRRRLQLWGASDFRRSMFMLAERIDKFIN